MCPAFEGECLARPRGGDSPCRQAAGMQVAVTVSSDPGAQVLDKDIIRISSEAQAKEWAQGSIFAVVQCQGDASSSLYEDSES